MSERITRAPQGIDDFIKILRENIPAHLVEKASALLLETDKELEQFARALNIVEYLRNETELEPTVSMQLLDCLSSLRLSLGKS